MLAFRRRLASCALAVSVLQLALLFAAPVSACCARSGAPDHATGASDDVECCPAGTHPPGQCPLHRELRTTPRGSSAAEARREGACRMMCDAPHGPEFLLGAVGLLPVPQSIDIHVVGRPLQAGARLAGATRPSLPDAPPPRLL